MTEASSRVQFTFQACADLNEIWESIAMPSDLWGSTNAEHLAAGPRAQGGVGGGVDAVAQEADGTVGQQEVAAAGVVGAEGLQAVGH